MRVKSQNLSMAYGFIHPHRVEAAPGREELI